jgi:cold shock CspA family protein
MAMKLPMQITFRNVESSNVAEQWIRMEAEKLETFYNAVMRCRVKVEIPHGHHRKGKSYHVRIELTVPGGELVINRAPHLSERRRGGTTAKLTKRLEVESPHKSLRIAIHEAFKTASRRLQDHARRQRGDIKHHEPLPSGKVGRLFQDKDYGFLLTQDGREVYFHKASVLNEAFPRLKVGTPVKFIEELGDKGAQASTVRIVGGNKVRQKARTAAASAV